MKTGKSTLLIWAILMVVWLVLNDSFHPHVLIAGVVFSGVLALAFGKNAEVYSYIRLDPKALIYTVMFFFVFLWELAKANLDVAMRVISPKVRINPGIVEIKTKLKSPLSRIALANAITLTPGTLTVDIKGDSLFIHWIDVTTVDPETATKEIAATFEKYLEVIYG